MRWAFGGWKPFIIGLIVAVTVFGTSNARRSCNTARYGIQRGRQVHVQDQHLSPDAPDWRITVPPVCNKIVGVSVTACDINGAPSVFLSSLTRGLIMRSGPFSTGAYLYVTAYCDPSEEEEEMFEIHIPRPPPRYKRPTQRPRPKTWLQNSPQITADEIIVLNPPAQWPMASTDYPSHWADDAGTNPYLLSYYDPASMSQLVRSDTSTAAPKNATQAPDVTVATSVQPERSFAVDPLQSGPWPAEIQDLLVTAQTTTTPAPKEKPGTLNYLKQLALWWLKRVRGWTKGNNAERKSRRFNGRGTPRRLWQSPKYYRSIIDYSPS